MGCGRVYLEVVLTDITEFGLSGLLLGTEVSTVEPSKDGRMQKQRFQWAVRAQSRTGCSRSENVGAVRRLSAVSTRPCEAQGRRLEEHRLR